MPSGRSSSETIARKRQSMLEMLIACAEHGRPCPPARDIAALLQISGSMVTVLLGDLVRASLIKYRLVNAHVLGGRARIVTILATGKSTPMPRKARTMPPAAPFTPSEYGCPVKDLRRDAPARFRFWKAHYEAREAQTARKAATANGVWG